jgi:undecaprenyl-diphosphatase
MPEPLAALDSRIALWLHEHASPGFTAAMMGISELHAQVMLLAYAAVLALYLARRREWAWLRALVLCVPAGMALNAILKLLVQRARPVFEHPLATLQTYSFPSGHAAGATLLYGFLVAYVFAHTRRRAVRAGTLAGAAAMVALVSFSRLYLGVHYLTDVVGAIAWTLLWLALVLSLVLRHRGAGRPR